MNIPDEHIRPYKLVERTSLSFALAWEVKPLRLYRYIIPLYAASALFLAYGRDTQAIIVFILTGVVLFTVINVILSLNPLHIDCRSTSISIRYRSFFGTTRNVSYTVGDLESFTPEPYSLRGQPYASVQIHLKDGSSSTIFAGARSTPAEASEHSQFIAQLFATTIGLPATVSCLQQSGLTGRSS